MKSEHKKLMLGVGLLLLAGGVLTYFYWPEGSPLPKKTPFICVASGEVFALAQNDLPLVFPARNPKTGQDTLIPAEKREDGRFVAMSRYARGLLREKELARLNRYVDPNTLELLSQPRQP